VEAVVTDDSLHSCAEEERPLELPAPAMDQPPFTWPDVANR
jgi:hypothetical protein